MRRFESCRGHFQEFRPEQRKRKTRAFSGRPPQSIADSDLARGGDDVTRRSALHPYVNRRTALGEPAAQLHSHPGTSATSSNRTLSLAGGGREGRSRSLFPPCAAPSSAIRQPSTKRLARQRVDPKARSREPSSGWKARFGHAVARSAVLLGSQASGVDRSRRPRTSDASTSRAANSIADGSGG